jgi:heme-degrading monooxygenase HmoA
MSYLLVRHKVADYEQWKSVFDAFIETRRAGGEKSYQILCVDGDPNNLVLLFEWESLEKAHAFIESAALRDAMKKGGVAGTPDVYYLEEVVHATV